MTDEQQNLIIPTYSIWKRESKQTMPLSRKYHREKLKSKRQELSYARKEYGKRRSEILGEISFLRSRKPKLNIDPMRYGEMVKDEVKFAKEHNWNIRIKTKRD